jgi:internalin A
LKRIYITLHGLSRDEKVIQAANCRAEELVNCAISSNAEELDLSSMPISLIPASIKNIVNLKSINLSRSQSLTDISNLSLCLKLENIIFHGCTSITEEMISVISECQNLKHLDISYSGGLTDLTLERISKLVQLTYLSFGDLKVTNEGILFLGSLKNLKFLSLSQIHNLTHDGLSFLSGLHELKHLQISNCHRLRGDWLKHIKCLKKLECLDFMIKGPLDEHMDNLKDLKNLKSLNLIGCSNLSDKALVSFVGMKNIEELKFSNCSISDTSLKIIATFEKIRVLALHSCSSITDSGVSLLKNSKNIRVLNLSGCSITDTALETIRTFRNLKELELKRCLSITMAGIDRLSPLKFLERFSSDTPFECHPNRSLLRYWSKQFKYLDVASILSAPQELASPPGKAIDNIRQWQDDLIKFGEVTNNECKIFLLGNGGCGKTQIARRLRGLSFETDWNSTHGIDVQTCTLRNHSVTQTPISAKIWDFGGQDIYLNTHRLFLDDRSIYVLTWTPDLDNSNQVGEGDWIIYNRPVSYWLDYIFSLAGENARIILVQTKCDSEFDIKVHSPDRRFKYFRSTACSAKIEDGFDRFMPELRGAAKSLIQEFGEVVLPKNWISIIDTLRLKKDNGIKVISFSDFASLLSASSSIANPSVIARYLHSKGEVYWSESVFSGSLILDQSWALAGVYSITEPLIAKQLKQRSGRFTLLEFSNGVWSGYSSRERQLFVEMLLDSKLIFEIEQGNFIAIQHLPVASQIDLMRHKIWRNAEPAVETILEYDFLHEGIINDILCNVGKRAGSDAVYWKNGVCFYDVEAESSIWIEAECGSDDPSYFGGIIRLKLSGLALATAQHLISSITSIQIGCSPKILWVKGNSTESVKEAAAEPFSNIHAGACPSAVPYVYISYAWSSNSDNLIDKLDDVLRNSGIHVKRDIREIRLGEWISDFILEVGSAELIVVVLTNNYLQSPNCMRELYHLYQTSGGKKSIFLERIVPLVDDDLNRQNAKWANHWNEQYRQLELSIRDLPPEAITFETKTLREYSTFRNYVSEMVDWIDDVLIPRKKVLEENSFSEILALISERRS